MIKDIWREGKYFDLWSLVHVLSGVFSGIVAVVLSIPYLWGLVILTFLAILWEFYEIKKSLRETIQNRMSDVIVAILAFSASYYYLYSTKIISLFDQYISLIVIVCIIAVLNYFGWKAKRRNK